MKDTYGLAVTADRSIAFTICFYFLKKNKGKVKTLGVTSLDDAFSMISTHNIFLKEEKNTDLDVQRPSMYRAAKVLKVFVVFFLLARYVGAIAVDGSAVLGRNSSISVCWCERQRVSE